MNNVEYNLWLENDLNTKGHTQWYYFKVIYKYPKSNQFLIKYRLKNTIQHSKPNETIEPVLTRNETMDIFKTLIRRKWTRLVQWGRRYKIFPK